MTLNETRLKNIPPVLDEWLTSQAAIAGIAKTKYIIQVLEDLRSNAGQTHPHLSPKISPESPVDVNIYEEVAAIKARLTKLEQGSPNDSPDKPQFYEGQLITGQHSKLYNLVFNSFETSQKVDRTEYHLSNELNIICRVTGYSKANKKKLRVIAHFPGDQVVINNDDSFLVATEKGVRWEFEQPEVKLEEATAEPTSPVDPTNNETPKVVVSHPLAQPISAVELPSDEIVIKAVTEAPGAQDEPLKEVTTTSQTGDSSATEIVLSRDKLVQRLAKNPGDYKTFGANLTSVGGASMKAKAIIDWTSKHDPEGKSWMPEDGTRETWVMQPNTSTVIAAIPKTIPKSIPK